jgi:hypothetical protein
LGIQETEIWQPVQGNFKFFEGKQALGNGKKGKAVDLERGPLSLVRKIEELLE